MYLLSLVPKEALKTTAPQLEKIVAERIEQYVDMFAELWWCFMDERSFEQAAAVAKARLTLEPITTETQPVRLRLGQMQTSATLEAKADRGDVAGVQLEVAEMRRLERAIREDDAANKDRRNPFRFLGRPAQGD